MDYINLEITELHVKKMFESFDSDNIDFYEFFERYEERGDDGWEQYMTENGEELITDFESEVDLDSIEDAEEVMVLATIYCFKRYNQWMLVNC